MLHRNIAAAAIAAVGIYGCYRSGPVRDLTPVGFYERSKAELEREEVRPDPTELDAEVSLVALVSAALICCGLALYTPTPKGYG